MVIDAKELLAKISEDYQVEKRISSAEIMDIWNRIIAPRIPTKSRATIFASGILHVSVEKPTWSQELTFLKEVLIEEMNKAFGEERVKDIRVHTGEVIDEPQREGIALGPNNIVYEERQLDDVVLDGEEMARIDKEAMAIKDEGIREKYRRIRIKELALKKAKEVHINNVCVICQREEIVESDMCQDCLSLSSNAAVIKAVGLLEEDVTLLDGQIKVQVEDISEEELKVSRNIVFINKKDMLKSYVDNYNEHDLEIIELIWRMCEESMWAKHAKALEKVEREELLVCFGEKVVLILDQTRLA